MITLVLFLSMMNYCHAQYSNLASDQANQIWTDTTKFTGILSASNYSVQSALESLSFIASSPTTVTANWDFGGGELEIPNSATLPATCDAGDVYLDTDATSGQQLYGCESADNWVLQGDGGAGGTGDLITVGGVAADTTGNWSDSGDIDYTLTDGGAGGPDDITGVVKANSVALGTDTVGEYALGDSEGGAAVDVACYGSPCITDDEISGDISVTATSGVTVTTLFNDFLKSSDTTVQSALDTLSLLATSTATVKSVWTFYPGLTIGDGSSGDIGVTFDGDAGIDGSVKWDVSEDELDITGAVNIGGGTKSFVDQGSGDLLVGDDLEVDDDAYITDDLGIATTTPSATLDVGGGTATTIDGTDDILVADDIEVDGDAHLEGTTYIGTLLEKNDTCLDDNSDRFYSDKNCSGAKDIGEQFLDGTGLWTDETTYYRPNDVLAISACAMGPSNDYIDSDCEIYGKTLEIDGTIYASAVTVSGTAQSTFSEGVVINNLGGGDEDDDFTVNRTGGTAEFTCDAGDAHCTFTSSPGGVIETKCIFVEDPTNESFYSIALANKNMTIQSIWCESDQTAILDLQIDDGTAAAVNGSNITCTSTPVHDTSLAGDTDFDDTDTLDLVIASVSGTPTWVSVCWETKSD